MASEREVALFFGAGLGAFAGALARLTDAFVGDLHGVRHFFCGGSRERAIQACDVDATVPHLGVYGGVHRGEEFVAQLVEDAVYVEVRQVVAPWALSQRYLYLAVEAVNASRTTTPPFITRSTCSRTSMRCNGSVAVAIRSA